MNVDPKTPIAGLRPAVLKRVFARAKFSAAEFRRLAGVSDAEPKLLELADLGWVERDPQAAWRWMTTEQGARLAAASLLPPMKVEAARDLVRQVVAAAEAVNADATHFYAVQRLVLFGSLLDAAADRSVGDADIGYELVRREPDDAKSQDLASAELELMPSSFKMPSYFWHSERVLRQFKVHRKVALHMLREVQELKIANVVIYDREDATIGLPW
jgi:hypothetical protein